MLLFPLLMNILFIGDIYGRPGRETIKKVLKDFREKHDINLVIANAENMRHGKGVSQDNVEEMQKAGVDFFTSGNHIWQDKSIIPYLDDPKLPIIRPANYPSNTPGRGYQIVETNMMKRVLVINLLGRVFMPHLVDDPFKKTEQILEETKGENLDAIFVDFHAEATSEKVAFGHFMDGKVTAVVGTHTHVPTRDDRILEGGTAYQSDVGMTGVVDSVIGAEKSQIIDHFLTGMPLKVEVAEGPTVFNAVKIEVDPETRLAKKIEHIQHYLV